MWLAPTSRSRTSAAARSRSALADSSSSAAHLQHHVHDLDEGRVVHPDLAGGVLVQGGLKAGAGGEAAGRPEQSVLQFAVFPSPGHRFVRQAGGLLPVGAEAGAQLDGESAGGLGVGGLLARAARAEFGAQQLGEFALGACGLLRGVGALAGAGLVAWRGVVSPGTPRLPQSCGWASRARVGTLAV